LQKIMLPFIGFVMGAHTMGERESMVRDTRETSSRGCTGTFVSGLLSQIGIFGEETARGGVLAEEADVSNPPKAKSKPSSVPKSANVAADRIGDVSAWVCAEAGNSPNVAKFASSALMGKFENSLDMLAPAKNPAAPPVLPPSAVGNVDGKSPQPSTGASATTRGASGAARDDAEEAVAVVALAAPAKGSRRGLGGGWAASSLESIDRMLGFRPCFA
jgi:hypothetical protein